MPPKMEPPEVSSEGDLLYTDNANCAEPRGFFQPQNSSRSCGYNTGNSPPLEILILASEMAAAPITLQRFQETRMQSKSLPYINGFDWVRASMSVLVVMWHLRTFGKSLLYTENFERFRFNPPDVFAFHIVVVSVPVFVLLSCYLTIRNQTGWPRLRHRLWRLIVLVVFWTVLMSLWKGGYGELRKMIPTSLASLFEIVFSANGEFYYFFVVLIYCSLISFGTARLSALWNWIGLALSTALMFFLPRFVMSNGCPILLAYWHPLNFLAYPFAAALIYRYQDRLVNNLRSLFVVVLVLLAISALFAWYEWTHYIQAAFLPAGLAFPLLMRASHVYLAAALFIPGLWPCRAAPAVIRFMSANSLALYVLHGFYRPIVLQNTPALPIPDSLTRLLQLTVTILLCYATAYVLPLFLKEDLFR